MKRTLDLIVAVVALIILLPVIAVVALVVRVTLGSPVLFYQQRLGRGGHPFELYKFRTMRHPLPGREAPGFDAERMTPIGSWLRATSLDELPSLWNLLRGDVTLVGPRPLPVNYWHRFRGDEYERFLVRPGITGLAQMSGRNSVDWPERLALDVRYVRERSLLGDLWLVLRTVPTVLRRDGVHHAGVVTMHELPADRPGSAIERAGS